MFKLLSILVLLVQVLVIIPVNPSVFAATVPYPPLVFSELKVRHDTSNATDYDEYIEMLNTTNQAILLENFVLEYYNSTNPTELQQPVQKPISSKILAPLTYITLAKQPSAIEFSQQLPFSSLSDTGGRLRLVTAEGEIVDEVAWTNNHLLSQPSSTPPILYQCNTSTIACSANRSQSFSRTIDLTSFSDVPIWTLGSPSPHSDELSEQEPVVIPPDEEVPPEPEPDEVINPPVTCEGVIINEILPNPDGSDTGKEFIELYNPTAETVALSGCSLQTSSNSKTYDLSAIELQPNAFISLYDTVTTLTLTNAAGGTVWLLSSTEEVHVVTYPAAVDDSASWSYFAGIWEMSYIPTPGGNNISLPIKPCPTGQLRNTSTGLCEEPVTAKLVSLTPCKPGQERNVETNRCRAVTIAASSVLATCKEGQERNPETNRCRSVLSATSITPCDADEERNPETNRCRKISTTGASTLANVKDVVADNKPVSPSWWVIGITGTGALVYGIYEWRRDIVDRLRGLIRMIGGK